MGHWFGKTGRGRIAQFFGNDPTLTGYFQLNGSSRDNSGNAHDGSDTGVTYLPQLDRFAGGASFDGSTSNVNTGNWLSGGVSAMTVMAWIKTTSSSGLREIASKGSNVFDFGIGWTTASKAQFWFHNASTFVGSGESVTPVTDGRLHLLCGVYDGANVMIYVDGKLESAAACTGSSPTATGNVTIGSQSNGISNFWLGSIVELAVLTRGVPAQQIAQYWAWATKRKKTAVRALLAAGTTWVRSASATVSNAASRSATASFLHGYIRGASATVSNAAGRLATASKSFIIKIGNTIRWGFFTWD